MLFDGTTGEKDRGIKQRDDLPTQKCRRKCWVITYALRLAEWGTLVTDVCRQMGISEATFYVWIPCPKGYTSTELCARILDEADVVTTPGLGFGRTADGYIRAALTVDTPRLLQAVERIGKLSL